MPMTHKLNSVSSTGVLDLIETCRRHGLIDEAELASLDIDRSTLEDSTARLPEPSLIALWHHLARQTKCPHIGLLVGQTINPSAKGILASWVSQANTLGEALTIFIDHIALMNPSEIWSCHIDNGMCELVFRFRSQVDYPAIAIERSLSAMLTWGRALSGKEFGVQEAQFRFGKPRYANMYYPIFGKHITFNAEQNLIRFDASILSSPVSSRNPFLKKMVAEQALSDLKDLRAQAGIRGRIKNAVINSMNGGAVLNNEEICQALNISRQTLYRALKKEGTTYKEIIEELRQEEAMRLLAQQDLSLEAISLQLGFQNSSSFYKACQRWFGKRPAELRPH